MTVQAKFLRTRPGDLRAGEARVLRVTGLDDGETFVFLDARDNVSRVQRSGEDTTVVSWDVQQVLSDVLDPHAVSAE